MRCLAAWLQFWIRWRAIADLPIILATQGVWGLSIITLACLCASCMVCSCSAERRYAKAAAAREVHSGRGGHSVLPTHEGEAGSRRDLPCGSFLSVPLSPPPPHTHTPTRPLPVCCRCRWATAMASCLCSRGGWPCACRSLWPPWLRQQPRVNSTGGSSPGSTCMCSFRVGLPRHWAACWARPCPRCWAPRRRRRASRPPCSIPSDQRLKLPFDPICIMQRAPSAGCLHPNGIRGVR